MTTLLKLFITELVEVRVNDLFQNHLSPAAIGVEG
jgi:hypothetical protein